MSAPYYGPYGGNIDLNHRPHVRNKDGSISTIRSITIDVTVGSPPKRIWYAIPTVVGNRVVSNDAAIAYWRRTGKFLGVFTSAAAAKKGVIWLHNQQAALDHRRGLYDVTADLHRRTKALEAVLFTSSHFAVFPCTDGCSVVRNSPYAEAVISDGPLVYWECQDCPDITIADSSGNDVATDVSSTYSWSTVLWRQPGPLTSSCDKSFGETPADGIFNAFSPTNGPLDLLTDNFSIEFWFLPIQDTSGLTNSYDTSIFQRDGDSRILMFDDGGGTMHLTLFKTGFGNMDISGGPGALPFGSWFHQVLVRDSGVWGSYVNGSATFLANPSWAPSVPFFGPVFGTSTWWNIAHVAYYGYALSAAQVAAHYAAA